MKAVIVVLLMAFAGSILYHEGFASDCVLCVKRGMKVTSFIHGNVFQPFYIITFLIIFTDAFIVITAFRKCIFPGRAPPDRLSCV